MITSPQKLVGFHRYTRRYARHAPPRPGRKREFRPTLGRKYGRPFDILWLGRWAWPESKITEAHIVRITR